MIGADAPIHPSVALLCQTHFMPSHTTPRGEIYVHIEVGHAAQNICLQATALGLGLVTVGAFQDDLVKMIIGMEADETPLYIIPVGRET